MPTKSSPCSCVICSESISDEFDFKAETCYCPLIVVSHGHNKFQNYFHKSLSVLRCHQFLFQIMLIKKSRNTFSPNHSAYSTNHTNQQSRRILFRGSRKLFQVLLSFLVCHLLIPLQITIFLWQVMNESIKMYLMQICESRAQISYFNVHGCILCGSNAQLS